MTMTDTEPLVLSLEDLESEIARLQQVKDASKKKVSKAKKKHKKAKKGLLSRIWKAVKRSAKWVARKAKAAYRLAKKALTKTGRAIKSVAKRIANIKFVQRLWSGLKWLATPAVIAVSWLGKAVTVTGHWLGSAVAWLLSMLSLGLVLVVLGVTIALVVVGAVVYKVVQGAGLALVTPSERRTKKGRTTNSAKWGVYRLGWHWRNMLPLTLNQISIRESVREQNLRDQAESKKARKHEAETTESSGSEAPQPTESVEHKVHPAQQPKGRPTPRQRKTNRHHGERHHYPTVEERHAHGPQFQAPAKPVPVPDDEPPF